MKVDEVRGVACLLVVIFHAVGSEPSLVASGWGFAMTLLGYVRLPLFIAITGYLYGSRRAEQSMSWSTWTRRTGRMWRPFIVVSIACATIDWAGGGTFGLPAGLVFGIWHLWYLQALAIILLIVFLFDRTFGNMTNYLWPLALVAACGSAAGFADDIAFLSTGKAFYLLPHFVMGAAIGGYGFAGRRRGIEYALYAAGLVALVLAVSAMASGRPWSSQSLVGTAIGWASFAVLHRFMVASRTMAALGRYAFPVFLWHLPVSAAVSGVFLNPLGIEPHASVIVRVAAGVLLPMLAVRIAEGHAPALIPYIGRRSRDPRPSARSGVHADDTLIAAR